MDFTDFIGPWVSLLVILMPLIAAERWIHQHCYGVGYLLFGDKKTATGFYYIVFFPAVFLHEFTQYLVAGALSVPLKKLELRLHQQDNGTMRYDFVTIQPTDPIRSSIIGGAPFVLGAFLFYYISTTILDLHTIPEAFASGKLSNVLSAIQAQFNTPDFWLWLYVLFTLSNGMIPTKEDRAGWWLVLAGVGGLSLVFLIMGLDEVLIETLTGPVRETLELVTTSLSIIFLIDLAVILLLGITEDALERYRGFKMDYSGGKKKTAQVDKTRPIGSNIPLPKGELMPSVYNLQLPIPPIPDKAGVMRTSVSPSDVASGRPSLERPASATGSFPMRPSSPLADDDDDEV